MEADSEDSGFKLCIEADKFFYGLNSGSKIDHKKARQLWLTAATDFRHPLAVGRCCFFEIGDFRKGSDGENVFNSFREAAHEGGGGTLSHYIGEFLLGFCYSSGTGTYVDKLQAFEITLSAAEKGNYGPAMTNVARALWKKESEAANFCDAQDESQCEEKALSWYKRAASECGVASAQYELGKIMLDCDESSLKDEGKKWIMKAGEQGHSDAERMVKECVW